MSLASEMLPLGAPSNSYRRGAHLPGGHAYFHNADGNGIMIIDLYKKYRAAATCHGATS
jgi:hypothetical protein